jgi:hypothetical protein
LSRFDRRFSGVNRHREWVVKLIQIGMDRVPITLLKQDLDFGVSGVWQNGITVTDHLATLHSLL